MEESTTLATPGRCKFATLNAWWKSGRLSFHSDYSFVDADIRSRSSLQRHQVRNVLFYDIIQLSETDADGRYSLSPLANALKWTGLESPLALWPNSSYYDINSNGIAFVAKDPNLDPHVQRQSEFLFPV
jgi:hypothetical protein